MFLINKFFANIWRMSNKKIGIINDARMLKHKAVKYHPETPKRVEEIMNLLQKTGYLDNPIIDFIPNYERQATNEELQLVYPSKYVKYVSKIWPKESHRKDISVLDTYFCQYSEEASKLAVGGVLIGTDKIMEGAWKSGFAVVRPPGHHSGARNTINGFCIFNNVAIAARYLQKKYGVKKIAIIDWDIHLGDGTHHVFANDPNVLFISIHRYDHGTYYPAGETGSFLSCGLEDAKGSNINVPLNYLNQNFKAYEFQAPGDNQYVYLYNRIVDPIIREFEPEFIFVSSGFDASRYDPIGGFTVTPNGFFYMAKRVAQLKIPLLVVLEGGYNVQQTAMDALAVVKGILTQDNLPQANKLSYQELAENCHLEEAYHENFDNIIAHHSEYWKSLQSPELLKYTEHVKGNKKKLFGVVQPKKEVSSSSSSSEKQQQQTKVQQLFQIKAELPRSKSADAKAKKQASQKSEEKTKQTSKQQASEIQPGKTGQNKQQSKDSSDQQSTHQFYFVVGHMQRFKNFSISSEKLWKWAYPEEAKFYESNFPETEFAPKYFGRDGDYIIIQNLLFEQIDHIVADFKMSRHSKKPGISAHRAEKQIKKQASSTSGKYSFRLCGFTTPTYKEGGLLVSDEEFLKKIFKKIVTADNKEYFCDFLTRLSQTLKGVNRRYYNSSILISKGKNKSMIKWIDFHYWQDNCNSYDADLVEGLENLCKFIQETDTSAQVL